MRTRTWGSSAKVVIPRPPKVVMPVQNGGTKWSRLDEAGYNGALADAYAEVMAQPVVVPPPPKIPKANPALAHYVGGSHYHGDALWMLVIYMSVSAVLLVLGRIVLNGGTW